MKAWLTMILGCMVLNTPMIYGEDIEEADVEFTGISTQIDEDFDGDGELDQIVVADFSDGTRQLHVMTSKGLEYINSDFMMGAMDGGVWGDPLDEISVSDGVLTIRYFGGSRERWFFNFTFQWQEDDFVLVSYSSGTFDTFDLDAPENTFFYDVVKGTITNVAGDEVGVLDMPLTIQLEDLKWENLLFI